MKKIKYIIFLRNPKSTNIDLADRHITEIKAIYPDVPSTIIDTATTAPQTYARLRGHKDKLGPATLLCVAGGDGTVNRALEFLATEQDIPAQARKTVLLPLWAGNANDLAHMINGSVLRIKLPQLFTLGAVSPIYPLVCTLIDIDGHHHVYHAASYAGFGVTAAVARAINRHEHRSQWWHRLHLSRLAAEMLTVWRAVREFSGFTLYEAGQENALYERSYVNGSRMAKMQPLAASLTERSFLQTTVYKRDKHLFAFYRWLRGSVRLPSNKALMRNSTFTTEDTIWMQCDGETVRVPKGTQVNIRCASSPLYVFGTKLQRRALANKK